MARSYVLKRRAEQLADTRLRIVEAAVGLHGSVGPARTTLTMVAERAGVQRHTLYAHFPNERSLFLACSGLGVERDPPPDADAWPEGPGRLPAGLDAIYGWYRRNEALAACVLRDAEIHPLTREVTELRLGPPQRRWRAVLGEGLGPAQRAVLHVMIGFPAWRSLARDSGLDPAACVAVAVAAIGGAAAAAMGADAVRAIPPAPDLL
ncbi:TetR/AcrR family transcriptional regulator [Roseomonas terrae]|jgi:AcrR family transcriptional regulator|uniref:TetR/AcrR family transcriptional regulator n=1 Tax=Neoroseomonas terrae TaxID=424799 RepID=A0ABS5EQA3_9PROT|nr:TetR/AcrR family transcriptional regulator [Neoroseomonas terrae]MBR0653216.1 TetR/AcrR family transcriptional regulator [Neoroseomonas terrae]